MKVTVVVDFIFSELNPVTDTPSCCKQAACLDGIKFQYTALRGTLSEDFYFIRDIIKFWKKNVGKIKIQVFLSKFLNDILSLK